MSMLADRAEPPFRTASVHVTYLRRLGDGSSATFRGTVHHLGRSLAVIGVEASSGARIAVRAMVVAQRLPGAGAF
jgi:acyl-coenzyme A thioesterase PaaI-like protein